MMSALWESNTAQIYQTQQFEGNLEEEYYEVDDNIDDIIYNELYVVNDYQYKDEEKNDDEYFDDIYSLKKDYVCKFYNPYFCSGCQYGSYCQFRHLSESSFLKYCHYSSINKAVDSHAEKTFEKSLDYIENNQIKQAYLLLRKLVLEYELNSQFNFWLGRCRALFPNATNEDMNTAQFYYRKAIAMSPSNSSFHSYYAQFSVDWAKRLKLKVRCSEYKQAKDHFKKSLKLRDNPTVHFQFAKFLDEIEGQYFEAINHYKCALQTYEFKNDARLRLNYARCLHKMKRHTLSKKQFLIIFNIYKNHNWQCPIWPHFHYAKLLIDMQFYQQAFEELEFCINLMNKINNKYFSEIYYEMSKLLCCYLSQYNKALECIQFAIQLSPQRKYYTNLLHQIEQCLPNEEANEEAQEASPANEQTQTQKQIQKQIPKASPAKGFGFGGKCCDDDEDDGDDEYEEDGEEKHIQTETKHPFTLFGVEEESESECDDHENEFLASRFCASEFDRFISSDISFGDEFEKYCDKFEDEKANDIRWLINKNKENILNDEWLKNNIGMNNKSIKLWKQSVNIFTQQYNKYILWLKKNDFYKKYFKKFETYGILHLQSFFYHVKNQDDVAYMIGSKNKNDARLIWKSAEKEMKQITQHEKTKTKTSHTIINQSFEEHKHEYIEEHKDMEEQTSISGSKISKSPFYL